MRLLAPILLFGLLAMVPAAAESATVTIPGDPMTVYVNDTGGVTGRLAGDTSNVFFSPSSNTSPNAGFNLGFPVGFGTTSGPLNYGSAGGSFTGVSQGVVTGTGTAATPYRVTTTYRVPDGAGSAVTVTQVVTYLNGTSRFGITYAVTNVSGAPLRFRAGEFADLYLAGSDSGTGFFDANAPRLVGGFNAVSARVGGIEEVPGSPWDAYREDQYSTVEGALANLSGTGSVLDNTINPAPLDNGVAVQWDDYLTSGLANNATASFATAWTFAVGRLLLSPGIATREPGSVHSLAVTLRDPNGVAVTATPVRYAVSGSNPTAGAVTTDGAGRATITLRGARAGTDTLDAYADLNSSGSQDASEPGATASVRWAFPAVAALEPPVDDSIDAQLRRLPPPKLGKTVNVAPVKGEVFVRLPGTSSAHSARSKGRGFIPLRQARQIPVGSLLDTVSGVVRLISAASPGKKQQGDFNGAFFTTLQGRTSRGLTELRLARGKFSGCKASARSGRRASTARRRYKKRAVRRLHGNAHGRFRTRGRYASATVRGTDWTVTDRCDGTLTRVKRGSVVVRDLRRHKNLVVRAGKSRLVRAPG